MRLTMKCSCGAEAEFLGDTFINGGGRPNERGQIFRVEVLAEEWQMRHDLCKPRPTPRTDG